jgi:hypothetical protein
VFGECRPLSTFFDGGDRNVEIRRRTRVSIDDGSCVENGSKRTNQRRRSATNQNAAFRAAGARAYK